MGESIRRKAHRSLCDVLAVLRATSARLERKHLVGQELRVKKRGSGITCEQLGQQVLRQSIQRGAEVHRDEAKTQCVGSGKILANFTKAVEHLLDTLIGGLRLPINRRNCQALRRTLLAPPRGHRN